MGCGPRYIVTDKKKTWKLYMPGLQLTSRRGWSKFGADLKPYIHC